MEKVIIPSVIARSQKELDERMKKIESKVYHLDIMDGKFVKNNSLMFDFRVPKNRKYQAHLMVKNPEKWILKNWKNVDMIIFHFESVKNPDELIKLVKSKKKKVGIAINPKTSIEKIMRFLSRLDVVLIMTVNPGRYGSGFLPNTLKKIKELRKLRPKLNIEVDGSINLKTIYQINGAGANSFVIGSYLQKNEDPKKALKSLKDKIK